MCRVRPSGSVILDHVQTGRFRYAPKQNEAVLLVRIDVAATINHVEPLLFVSERKRTVPFERGLN